jgi:Icc-related predicted phosphoesterase
MNSIWSDSVEFPSFEQLKKDIKTDVLIIGGGITAQENTAGTGRKFPNLPQPIIPMHRHGTTGQLRIV